MKSRQRFFAFAAILGIGLFILGVMMFGLKFDRVAVAQQADKKAKPSPTPEFDRRAAMAKLREQIKGREKEPAGDVFKNLKILNKFPAGSLLRIMGGGFNRALGVNCTHCHTPDDWSSDAKPTKQIARDMWNMQMKINGEILPSIEGLKDRRAIVNCTTCHRGEVKPATNLRRRSRPPDKKDTKVKSKNK